MFERILIALDLSENTQNIIRAIKRFRGETKRKIFLIHVVDMDSAGAMAGTLEAHDRQAIEGIANTLSTSGLDVDTRVAVGSPAKEILAYADEIDAELVAVGSHNKGTVSELILGSVSSEVIKRSKIPVLVLKD